MRVLVVDDEERIRKTWARGLKQAGHEVSACGSVASALRLLKREAAWDAVLLDIYLADGTGDELLKQMSAEQLRSVAVVSAYLAPRHAVELDGSGAFVSPKPTGVEDLLLLVDFLVQRRAAGLDSELRSRAWARRHKLSTRQAEILVLAVAGLTNDQIAQQLSCSKHSIDTHWSRIFHKTNVRGRAVVIAAASA